MLKIAIYDKDKRQQAQILDYIARDVDIEDDYATECFSDIETVKARIEDADFHFDIIFIEVDEKGEKGLSLASYIRSKNMDIDILFLAQTLDYITEAFRYRAFNYLVKPITFSKFQYEIKQYLQEHKNYQKDYLSVTIQGKEQMIPLNAVLYFASNGRKIGAFFANAGEEIWFYGKLNELEENLEKFDYIRCHQSYLVNGNKIENVDRENVYAGNEMFPISRKYGEKVQEQWNRIKKNRYNNADIMTMGSGYKEGFEDEETICERTATMLASKKCATGSTKYGLVVGIRGPRQNVSYRIYDEEEICIGRDSKQCQITINNGEVSRKHCGIKFDLAKQCYSIYDYSKNGVWIAGIGRITPNCWVQVEKDSLVQIVNDNCSFILV
ncbi:two-component response regulator [Clostridium sp. CAG:411]|jgi:DNA-binding LytR/AlgR family response regulator|nr:LytTR family transcriptional regulator DNA-binding domain-containing protein [Lachnospiraceae bacterium]CDE45872.1 two-component response regulator [Clostridium sp. CAG:411]